EAGVTRLCIAIPCRSTGSMAHASKVRQCKPSVRPTIAGFGGGMRAGVPTTEGLSANGSTITFGAALLGLVPVVLAIIVAAAIGCWSLKGLASAGNRAAGIHQTLDHFESLRSHLEEAEIRERDYLIAGDQQSWQAFQDTSDAI